MSFELESGRTKRVALQRVLFERNGRRGKEGGRRKEKSVETNGQVQRELSEKAPKECKRSKTLGTCHTVGEG